MRCLMLVRACVTVVAFVLLGSLSPAEDRGDLAERIPKAIARLGHDAFIEREKAMKELEAIGPPALEALRKSVESPDAEIKRRARELVHRIEKQVERDRILTPTRVSLSFKETPLREALADLAKKSGFPLAFRGDRAKLAAGHVTLDVRDVPFWEALDQLCRRAELTEAQTHAQPLFPAPELLRARVNGRVVVPPAPELRPPRPPATAGWRADNRPLEMFRPSGDVTPTSANPIILEEGAAPPAATFLAGAVRVRARDQSLQVSAEPKIPAITVREVHIERAVDDRGQALTPVLVAEARFTDGAVRIDALPRGASVSPAAGHVPLRFKAGNLPSKVAREIKGVVTLDVQTPPEPMITVDNVLKASGKTVKGPKGGSISVLEATAYRRGTVQLRVELELPPEVAEAADVALAGGLIVANNVNLQAQVRAQRLLAQRLALNQGLRRSPAVPDAGPGGFTLIDARGERYQQTQARVQMVANNNVISSQYVLIFQGRGEPAEPAKLVFSGSRSVTLDLPFTLHDVPLP